MTARQTANVGKVTSRSVSSHTPGYDHGEVVLYVTEDAHRPDPPPLPLEAWRIFTFHSPVAVQRRVPSLPGGMQITDLGGSAQYAGTWAIVRTIIRIDATHDPWSARYPTAMGSVVVEGQR